VPDVLDEIRCWKTTRCGVVMSACRSRRRCCSVWMSPLSTPSACVCVCCVQTKTFYDMYVAVSQAVRVALHGDGAVTEQERIDGSLTSFRFPNEPASPGSRLNAAARRSTGGGAGDRVHCSTLAQVFVLASVFRSVCSCWLHASGCSPAAKGVSLLFTPRRAATVVFGQRSVKRMLATVGRGAASVVVSLVASLRSDIPIAGRRWRVLASAYLMAQT
jgi:hypothetical protein